MDYNYHLETPWITLFDSSQHFAAGYVHAEQDGFRVELRYVSGDRRKAGLLKDLSAAIIEATQETMGRQIRPQNTNLATLVK